MKILDTIEEARQIAPFIQQANPSRSYSIQNAYNCFGGFVIIDDDQEALNREARTELKRQGINYPRGTRYCWQQDVNNPKGLIVDSPKQDVMTLKIRVRMQADKLHAATRRRQSREVLLDSLSEYSYINDDGGREVCVYFWSRDCDCCEADHVFALSAEGDGSLRELVKAFDKRMQEEAEGAEGPFIMYPIPEEDYENFKPQFHDLVMENMEEGGNGFNLTSVGAQVL